jgi:hypothetical protein
MPSSDPQNPNSSETPLTRFGDLLVHLCKNEVTYAAVGGVAVSLNGFGRFTVDVDLFLDDTPENLKRAIHALSLFGQGYARELRPADLLIESGSVRIGEYFDIDLFTRMMGLRFQDVQEDLRYTEYRGYRIPHVGPGTIIRLKTGSYREKDRLDVIAMRNILNDERAAAGLPPPTGFWYRLLARLRALRASRATRDKSA